MRFVSWGAAVRHRRLLWARLKDDTTFRVATLYAGASWFVVQLADTLGLRMSYEGHVAVLRGDTARAPRSNPLMGTHGIRLPGVDTGSLTGGDLSSYFVRDANKVISSPFPFERLICSA